VLIESPLFPTYAKNHIQKRKQHGSPGKEVSDARVPESDVEPVGEKIEFGVLVASEMSRGISSLTSKNRHTPAVLNDYETIQQCSRSENAASEST
jgi:hypothetical protein